MVLGGDFNLPDLTWSDDGCACKTMTRLNIDMKCMVDSLGFTQHVLVPTRGHNILDLLLCNHPDIVKRIDVIPSISDHDAVVATLRFQRARVKLSSDRKVFLYEKGNYEGISSELSSGFLSFECVAEETDVHNTWLLFRQRVIKLTEKYIPCIDASKLKNRAKPWINGSVLRLTKKRKRAYARYKKKKSAVNHGKLKELTTKYKVTVRKAKGDYLQRLEDGMKNNNKQFWKFMKRCGNDQMGIPDLLVNNELITDARQKACIFNEYFQSVFLPANNITPVTLTNRYDDMPPVEVGIEGVLKLLKNSDETKAIGPDQISPRVLKRCAHAIAPYLFIIFNQSLLEGSLPNDWKVAHVIPIHKKGPKKDVTTYRPISLTSICCKLLEHILYSQIMQHLSYHNFFIDSQHGFRRGYSCVTQLTELYHDLVMSVDKGEQTDCVFLDYRKAFDTVSHSFLLHKLNCLSIDITTLKWIQSYLSSRQQCVILNGEASHFVEVTSGVPQGSVLGPLLFLIFINDIHVNVTSQLRLFADDCAVYTRIKNGEGSGQLQADLDRIEQWCGEWGMQLNVKKCVHVSFTRKKNKFDTQYYLSNELVTNENKVKYLGVILSSDCTWDSQIDDVIMRAGRALGFVQRNLKNATQKIKELAYLAYVRPLLDYACTVWDPSKKNRIDGLEKIQNRAARFVLGQYDRFSSVTNMKQSLGWASLDLRRKNLRLKFLYNIYHEATGINSSSYLLKPNYFSKRNDHVHKIREYCTRTELCKNSFFVRTVKDWNALQECIVCAANVDMFFSLLFAPCNNAF